VATADDDHSVRKFVTTSGAETESYESTRWSWLTCL